MPDKWDNHFLRLCEVHSEMSKDPSTKVGAVIVGPDREVLSMGFNGFPRGVLDSEERLSNRDLKYKLMVHAELNAILGAARHGTRLFYSYLYVNATPCHRCAVEIIQSGIKTVIARPRKLEKWIDTQVLAKELFKEAKVTYMEIDDRV